MKVKRLRRKCDVRGCKNLDTYTLTRVREFGHSVIMCESCLKDALKAVKEYPDTAVKREISETPPKLFYENEKNETENIAEQKTVKKTRAKK